MKFKDLLNEEERKQYKQYKQYSITREEFNKYLNYMNTLLTEGQLDYWMQTVKKRFT